MAKLLHKVLFVAISFSFFISATEIDLGESHNTFFDEYDTYVKTEQVAVDQSTVEKQVYDSYALLQYTVAYYESLAQHKSNVFCQAKHSSNTSPPKLFLRHSVWRI